MAKSGSSIWRNTGYNLVGAIIPLLLSLIIVPLYLKLVGPERYGVLAIAWLLLGYFGLFDLGLGRATSFRIAALRHAPAGDRAMTLWTATAVNLCMGVIGALALWIAAGWFFTNLFKVDAAIRPEIIDAIPFLALTVPMATLTGVFSGALQGREQFLRTNVVSVISTVLFQLFPLAVAWLRGPELPLLLLAALAARLVAVIVLWAFCHAELTRGHPVRITKSCGKELLSFGGWVSITSLAGPLLVITDRFLIGAVLGAVAVTIYSVPFQLAQRIAIVPTALTNALFPRLSSASSEDQERLAALAHRSLAALITAPVLAGLLAIGPFLELWVGAEIGRQAAPIGRLILIGFWINAFALLPFTRLQASGRPDLVTKILLVQIPPYLGALILTMNHFGLIGCAVIFVVRCLADYILLSWAVERRVPAIRLFTLNLGLLAATAGLISWYAATTSLTIAVGTLIFLISVAISIAWLPSGVRHKLLSLPHTLGRSGKA